MSVANKVTLGEYERMIEPLKREIQPESTQPKPGHWIESHEHIYIGNGVKEWTNWYCSECDAPNDKPTDFCPSCGADMRGEGEGMVEQETVDIMRRIEALKRSESPKSSERTAESAQNVQDEDLISRKMAIEALARMMPRSYTPDGSHPADEEIFRAQEIFADCIEALEILPSAQPEPAIPLQWIEAQIEWLKSLDDAFSTLTAGQISAMVNKWRDEQDE